VDGAVKYISELKKEFVDFRSETVASNNANNTTQQGINANVNKIGESVKLVDGGLLNMRNDLKITNKIVTDLDATLNVVVAPKLNTSIEATNNMVAKVEANTKVISEIQIKLAGQAGAFNKMEEQLNQLTVNQKAGRDAITQQVQFTKDMASLLTSQNMNLLVVAVCAFVFILLVVIAFFVFIIHLVNKANMKVLEEKEMSRQRSEERYNHMRSLLKPPGGLDAHNS
jgi:hypothetical protein